MNQLSPNKKKLISLINEMIRLLDRYGGEWSSSFKEFRARLEKADRSVIDDIMGIYGGMGSFTDHIISGEPDGTKFIELANQIYALTEQIKKEPPR